MKKEKAKVKKVIKALRKASKTHDKQAKTLKGVMKKISAKKKTKKK